MSEYFTSDLEHPLSEDALRDADRETQLDVMETWFEQRFEDPAEGTPYVSAEGGYLWIRGGPYDAREELEREFSGLVSNDAIEELASELNWKCWEWAPRSSSDDYDQFIEDIACITEYYDNFSGAILDIEKLLQTKVDDSVSNCFLRMLYVNVITALETYLSDAFINTVLNAPNLMRRFIETTPYFQAERVPLSSVFKAVEEIERRARAYLIDVVWHHLNRVKPMYRATLKIEFPDEMGSLFQAILVRHDVVHRNGKTKGGEEILLTPQDIAELISQVEKFVRHIDAQLADVRSNFQLSTGVPP